MLSNKAMTADEKAVTEAAETARRYLDPMLMAPLSEFGLLLKDKISYWRFKNQVNTILKAKKFLEQKGVDPAKLGEHVDPELVVPLIETAATTADETLSTMFAGLLATSLQADAAEYMHKSYVQVLANLSPLDAYIILTLKSLIDVEIEKGTAVDPKHGPNSTLQRLLGFESDSLVSDQLTREQVMLSFENLWRLGICDRGTGVLDHVNRKDRLCFTDFGWSFIGACTKDIEDATHDG
jgi:hypothetical protein